MEWRSRNAVEAATPPGQAGLDARSAVLKEHAALAVGALKYPMNVLVTCKLKQFAFTVVEAMNAKLAQRLYTIGSRLLDVYMGPDSKTPECVTLFFLRPIAHLPELSLQLRNAFTSPTQIFLELQGCLLDFRNLSQECRANLLNLNVRLQRGEPAREANEAANRRKHSRRVHEQSPKPSGSKSGANSTPGFAP